MLIAEDDAATRDAVIAMLEELGITEVVTAFNGEQALKALEEQKFGTLLLDLMMPKVDGYEVLRELRKGNYKRPDRVIVMSAHAQPAELDGLMALGADAFMPKPFTLTDLEKILE
ncbi:MAG: response regulator [Chloroflexi bacterium]|nr:response regulator [Chloroflexota bacterium]MBT5627288.1 response regulator [Chloroflexota bacterium]